MRFYSEEINKETCNYFTPEGNDLVKKVESYFKQLLKELSVQNKLSRSDMIELENIVVQEITLVCAEQRLLEMAKRKE
jgi:hypothetical protein